MNHIRTLLLAGLTLAAGFAAWAGESARAFIDGEIRLPRLELVDSQWQRHELTGELTRGKIIVLNFSFTTCDSICPLGNDVMASVDAALQEMQTGRPVLLMTVTIDPRQDTPDVMAEAAERFAASDSWVWLTGAPGDIERMLEAFDANTTDILTHDPIFLVGDPDTGQFLRSLSMPAAEELIAAVRAFAG